MLSLSVLLWVTRMKKKVDISDMFEFKELKPDELVILKEALKVYRPWVQFAINEKKLDCGCTVEAERDKNQEILNKIDYLLKYL